MDTSERMGQSPSSSHSRITGGGSANHRFLWSWCLDKAVRARRRGGGGAGVHLRGRSAKKGRFESDSKAVRSSWKSGGVTSHFLDARDCERGLPRLTLTLQRKA